MKKHMAILWFVLAAAVATLAGCSYTTLGLTYYPGFFSSNNTYTTMAVAGVENSVEPGRYVRQLNSDIVSGYVNNGFYRVYDYTNENYTDQGLISILRENQQSQLVVFSTLTDYGENHSERTEYRHETNTVYATDEEGNIIYDENGDPVVAYVEEYDVPYTVFMRTAYAAMSVIVVEVESGSTLYNNVLDRSCYEEALDPRDMSSPNAARWCAIDKTTGSEVYQTAPTYDTVRVKIDDVVGVRRYDSEEGWVEDSKIPADEEVKLVFWFPKQALYNTFQFDIIDTENEQVLAKESIYWEGNTLAFKYSMDGLFEQSGGQDSFKVRLWNGNKVAIEKKFKIK